MGIILIVLLLLLLFIGTEMKKSRNVPTTHTEPFDGVGSTPPTFDPNSRNNDYYFDRTGRKGVLFKQFPQKNKYTPEPKKTRIINYNNTIHKLEIYPGDYYAPCVSKCDYNNLPHDIKYNDEINVYQIIEQGVLI